jgi:hypothetical protein
MSFVLLIWAAFGCDPNTGFNPGDSDDEEDLECPNIESIPVSSPQIIGTDVLVTANITDDSDVLTARLYYKLETSITWKDETMKASGNSWEAVIPAADVVNAAGMHYYVWAQDASPALNSCTLPNDGEEGPFHFTLDEPA